MKIKCEFSVDKFEESQMKDPAFLEFLMRQNAAKLGQYLVERIPFEKDADRSWPETVPAPSPFTAPNYRPAYDIYRCEFVALSQSDWAALRDAIQHIIADILMQRYGHGEAVRQIMQAVDYYGTPESER